MANRARGLVSDSVRDARRYHSLLLALSSAIETTQAIERSSPSIDMVLSRLMPDLAEALNARHAFVALQRVDEQKGEKWFELTAAWPRSDLMGQRLAPSQILDDLAQTGEARVIDPLGDPSPGLIPGLEVLEAVSGVLARLQTTSQTRIVGICNQQDARLGPYLVADGMALDSIVELVALGARAGERRRRELDGIQETSTALLTVLDLEEVLSIVVERSARVFDAPATSVMLWDRTQENLVVRDSWGLPEAYKEKHRLARSLVQAMATPSGRYRPLAVADICQLANGHQDLLEYAGQHLVLRAPLSIGGQLIGYLNIYGGEAYRPVTPEEVDLSEILAGQAALAIHRAELYEGIKRRSQHWQALHEASKAITEGFAADRKKTLDRIVEQAIECISGVHGPKASFGVIQIYDSKTREMCFESVYPPEVLPHLKQKLGDRRSIERNADPTTTIGITGRTVLTRTAQRVDSVLTDPDYLSYNDSTRSELSVPLVDGDEVIGVLSLESDELAGFDEDDEKALGGLAEMAVIVLKNQAQTELLNRTHALALMGAWGADVAHDTISHVGAIRRGVYLVSRQEGLAPELRERLNEVDKAAETLFSLQTLPPTPEPSAKVRQGRTLLDEVVCQEVEGLRGKYSGIEWHCEPHCAGLWVTMHEQWLRRVVRHLAHNAAAAMADMPAQRARRVTVRTAHQNDLAEVQVEDTGPGIARDVRSLLFRQPVFHPDGSQGRGLLLVRFIVEQHGGTVYPVWSREGEGSRFAFTVPSGAARDSSPTSPSGDAQ